MLAILGRFKVTDELERYWIRRNISEIIIHVNYGKNDSALADSDIALLIFDEAVEFTDYIQPICLPSMGENSYDIEGITVGYGRINKSLEAQSTPRHAKLLSISPSDCTKSQLYANDTVSLQNSFCAKSNTSVPCGGELKINLILNLNKNLTFKVTLEVLLWLRILKSGNY